MPDPAIFATDFEAVESAFSKQAERYDENDRANPILTAWRKQVYAHVNRYLTPGRSILELNAGTGIDALYFVGAGHTVHATDVSPGMIQKIREKIDQHKLHDRLTCQLCSFENLQGLHGKKFDYVFSNFGGLNCTDDLAKVTRPLSGLLNPGAYITWVIMPPVCLWELRWIFQGRPGAAFRRFKKNGTLARVEGNLFKTYYHSLDRVRNAFGRNFKLQSAEGLGALSPPPASLNFVLKHPGMYSILEKIDRTARNHFPFNRWADHIIVTFQYTP